MEQVIRRRVVVQPGGHIELNADELQAGAEADVIVIVHQQRGASAGKQAALEILDGLPGTRLFKTSSEADEYLRGERDSWDR
jgi:hypothetical protein